MRNSINLEQAVSVGGFVQSANGVLNTHTKLVRSKDLSELWI